MEAMNSISISTPFGEKTISVFACNIIDFDEEIDILATSAFYRSYAPTPRTVFGALASVGISAEKLAKEPEIDLRDVGNIWLSHRIRHPGSFIHRIGCIEMSPYTPNRSAWISVEEEILRSIKAYFQMLDIAATCGIDMETIALPLLGAGSQKISYQLTLIPLINECTEFLKRNSAVRRIYFIDLNPNNAYKLAQTLDQSYAIQKERSLSVRASLPSDKKDALAFISYASPDRLIADNLCAKLEARGIKAWYAPRNIRSNDYASAIVEAIGRCTHFIIILSGSSMQSGHVLNEIDLAFKELNSRGIRFLPLRLDEEELAPAFSYYLSRQHWMDAHIPPIEARLDEFVSKILDET